jgi:hypothetical protein
VYEYHIIGSFGVTSSLIFPASFDAFRSNGTGQHTFKAYPGITPATLPALMALIAKTGSFNYEYPVINCNGAS